MIGAMIVAMIAANNGKWRRIAAMITASSGDDSGECLDQVDDTFLKQLQNAGAQKAEKDADNPDHKFEPVAPDMIDLDHVGPPQDEEEFLAYLDRFQAKTQQLAAGLL